MKETRDEKIRILRLLESGKVTAKEAEGLLRAISKEREKMGVMDRIVGVVSSGHGGMRQVSEEFEAERLFLDVKASDLTAKESPDERFRIYGEGRVVVGDEPDVVRLSLFGSMVIEIPRNSSLVVNLKGGNLTGVIGVPVELNSKMSNIELRVIKPIDIDVNLKIGNLSLSFDEPVAQRFEVINSMGGVTDDFGLKKTARGFEGIVGEERGFIRIDAKLSSIELIKTKEV